MAFGLVPTALGLARIASAIAGTPLDLATMVLGDSNGVPYEPTGDETALVNEVYSGALTQLAEDPADPSKTMAQLIVPFGVGPFIVTEIGLKDTAGDLLFIGNYPLVEMPAVGSGAVRELVVQDVIDVSPTNVVTILVDPTILLATRAYVDAQIADARAYADAQDAAQWLKHRARRHFFAFA